MQPTSHSRLMKCCFSLFTSTDGTVTSTPFESYITNNNECDTFPYFGDRVWRAMRPRLSTCWTSAYDKFKTNSNTLTKSPSTKILLICSKSSSVLLLCSPPGKMILLILNEASNEDATSKFHDFAFNYTLQFTIYDYTCNAANNNISDFGYISWF